MTRRPWTYVLGTLAGLVLAGCEREHDTPAPLPVLERPTVMLAGPVGEHEKLLIPKSALTMRGGIPGVFVLSEAGEARFIMVKAGRARGTDIEVLSGLNGTETLVLGDLSAVYDGTPMRTRR